MRRVAGCLLCALLVCGCTYHVRRAGDDRFLAEPIEWNLGTTSVRDVVQQLGPPDAIRWSVGRLVLVYRSQRRVVTGLALSFYLKLFSSDQTREQDGTLLLAFDDRDLLLYYGTSTGLRSNDLVDDLGLR
jgi:hypothetical protein